MICERNMKNYCSEPIENIENYDKAVADTEHMWDCHHRAEILPCGRYTVAQLQKHGLYWHRPASELVFLRYDVHTSLHHKGKIAWNKGKPAWNKGKHPCEEHRRKMSESHKGKHLSGETKCRIAESQPMKKKVEMLRLSDGYIREFPSISEAARWLRENGHPQAGRAHIQQALKKNTHSCGAKWRYASGPV